MGIPAWYVVEYFTANGDRMLQAVLLIALIACSTQALVDFLKARYLNR